MRNALLGAAGALGFLLGVLGFASVRPPGVAEPCTLVAAVYHALGLFVLNAGPNGLPAGEPAWAVTVLWVAHFLAPLSLASVLVDAFVSVFSRRDRSYAGKEGHTVICGIGRTALLCVEELVAAGSARDLLVVELFRDCPQLPRIRELGIAVVFGSMTDEATLQRAGVEGASRFLAFANDDILNINAATTAKRLNRAREFTAVAQVTDARLFENLPESLKREIRFLNTHEIAADALVRTSRLARGYEDAYVIAGFGNFGQMVLKALLREETVAREDRFFVLDRDADEKVRMFVETFGFDDRDVRPVRGNLHDPALWQKIRDDLAREPREGNPEPLVLVCTDNDLSNLSLALSIRRRYVRESVIHCRLFGEVSFEQEMVRGHKIETYRVSELLRRNLPADVLGGRLARANA